MWALQIAHLCKPQSPNPKGQIPTSCCFFSTRYVLYKTTGTSYKLTGGQGRLVLQNQA